MSNFSNPFMSKSPLNKIRKSIEAQSRAAKEQQAKEKVNQSNVKSRLNVRKKDWDKKINKKEENGNPINYGSPLNKGKKVTVTTKSGKKVELDTRSAEYKSLMKAKKNKNTRSGVGFKDGQYIGGSESGKTQM